MIDRSPPGELLIMVRTASLADLAEIESIYSKARAFMKAHGNPFQWGTGYPERSMLLDDISSSSLFLVERDGRPAGVFYFSTEDDSTYSVIDGRWSFDIPYGAVHRIAAAEGEHGILAEALSFAFSRIGYIRIDTHRDNLPMRSALMKYGFAECGIIRTYDGTERIAYDKNVFSV